MTEFLYPVLTLWRREEPDSGGPGRHRGGLGASIAITPHGTQHPDGAGARLGRQGRRAELRPVRRASRQQRARRRRPAEPRRRAARVRPHAVGAGGDQRHPGARPELRVQLPGARRGVLDDLAGRRRATATRSPAIPRPSPATWTSRRSPPRPRRTCTGWSSPTAAVDEAGTAAERDRLRAAPPGALPGARRHPRQGATSPRPGGSTTTSSSCPAAGMACRPLRRGARRHRASWRWRSTRARPPTPDRRSSPSPPTTSTRPSCSGSTAARRAGRRCTRRSCRPTTATRSPPSGGSTAQAV